MPAFATNTHRDAWKVIKGFYYQVQVTVLRWLELKPNEVLYCESGEDIDHVRAVIDADADSQERLLEQVKVRSRISLNSAEAVSALARFHEAVTSNPTVGVLYRFSTTASPVHERRTTFPRGLSGIEAWLKVRAGELTPGEISDFASSLKGLVANARPPDDLPESVFRALQQHVASAAPEALTKDLVQRFEWATQTPQMADMRVGIHQLLIRQGRVQGVDDAALVAEVLVARVFHILTQRGDKRLVADDLATSIKQASITELDRALVRKLASCAERAETYLRDLSLRVSTISTDLGQLRADLFPQLAGVQNQLAGIVPTRLEPPDEPPLRPRIFASRAEIIREFSDCLRHASWLNLHGASGMGKTLSAELLSQSLQPRVWISLHGDLGADEAIGHLDNQILRLVAMDSASEDVPGAYVRGTLPFSGLVRRAANLGSWRALVLDDLPDVVGRGAVAERLIHVAQALSDSGKKLVTTSQRGLPASVRDQLGTPFREMRIPPMVERDVEEMLDQIAAPRPVRRYAGVIRDLTAGHPQLIFATIVYLEKANWSVDPLHALLQGTATHDVKEEARRKLLRLVPEDHARELVYRLSLLGAEPFGQAIVMAVASVPPPIGHAADRLAELVGPWVQQLSDDRFETCPVLAQVGQTALDGDTQRQVHRAVAASYLSSRSINSRSALQIIVHLLAARQWDGAAGFLLKLAMEVKEESHARAFDIVTSLFRKAWPQDAPLAFRIILRGVQARILMLLKKGADNTLAELDEAICEVTNEEDATMAFAALHLVGPLNPAASAALVARTALRSLRMLPRLSREIQTAYPSGSLEALVWVAVPSVRAVADVRALLAAFSEMTHEERRSSFQRDIVLYSGPVLLAERCISLELEKPEAQRNWAAVIALLDEMSATADLPGAEDLRAPTLCAKARVIADYLGQPAEALSVVDQALQGADVNGQLLLHYTGGSIELAYNTPEAALVRYEQAISAHGTGYIQILFDTFRSASEAAARTGRWRLARDLAVGSLEVRLGGGYFFERAEMMGELAWAYWRLGDRARASAAMSGLVRKLNADQRFDVPRYREVFGKAGHALGWMSAVAESGYPPTQTVAGQEYMEPFPGFFSAPRPRIAEFDAPRRFDILFNQLGLLAEGSNLLSLAAGSFERAIASSSTQLPTVVTAMAQLELASLTTLKGEYEGALSLAISGTRTLAVAHQTADRGSPIATLSTPIDVDSNWHTRTSEDRHAVELGIYWGTVGLAVAALLARDSAPEHCAEQLSRLDMAFSRIESDLAEPRY